MKPAGKVAVVTGGASGLGEACVRRLVTEGAKVLIMDMDEARGNKLAAGMEPGSAHFAKVDVTSPDQVRQALETARAVLGPIHMAINCAGIGVASRVLGREGPMDLGLFNKIIQVNLIGTFNVIRLAAQMMTANEPEGGNGEDGGDGRGMIVNTASIAGFEGQIGQAAYAASKGGIISMTLPIARELAHHGIRGEHRSRDIRYPHDGVRPREGPAGARKFLPVSQEVGLAIGICAPCPSHHRKPDGEQDHHSSRRSIAHGAQVINYMALIILWAT